MPVIPATQEAEIRRIMVQSQPGQTVPRPYLRKTHHKKRAGGVPHGEGPEFKLQYCKKKINNKQTRPEMYINLPKPHS
jgi:hypothetical protein